MQLREPQAPAAAGAAPVNLDALDDLVLAYAHEAGCRGVSKRLGWRPPLCTCLAHSSLACSCGPSPKEPLPPCACVHRPAGPGGVWDVLRPSTVPRHQGACTAGRHRWGPRRRGPHVPGHVPGGRLRGWGRCGRRRWCPYNKRPGSVPPGIMPGRHVPGIRCTWLCAREPTHPAATALGTETLVLPPPPSPVVGPHTQDQRLVFRMKKQRFVELLRRRSDMEALGG